MRQYKNNIIGAVLCCILLLMVLSGCGSADKSIKRGDAALALGEYAEAAAQYKRAYGQTSATDKKRRGFAAYKMGDAYRRYGNVARASVHFKMLFVMV